MVELTVPVGLSTSATLFKNIAATYTSVLTPCVPSFRYTFDEHDLCMVFEKACTNFRRGMADLSSRF